MNWKYFTNLNFGYFRDFLTKPSKIRVRSRSLYLLPPPKKSPLCPTIARRCLARPKAAIVHLHHLPTAKARQKEPKLVLIYRYNLYNQVGAKLCKIALAGRSPVFPIYTSPFMVGSSWDFGSKVGDMSDTGKIKSLVIVTIRSYSPHLFPVLA